MTSLAFAPTGSALGDYEKLATRDAGVLHRQTPVATVADPALRQALGHFDHLSLVPLAVLRSFGGVRSVLPSLLSAVGVRDAGEIGAESLPSETISVLTDVVDPLFARSDVVFDFICVQLEEAPRFVGTERDDAVDVIEGLVGRLGVPLKATLRAAGVKRVSFYSWKAPEAPRPRVASQARLWELLQTVEDLEELIGGPLRPWLLADRNRQHLLESGKFSELIELVGSGRRSVRKDGGATEYTSAYAVGADQSQSIDEIAPSKAARPIPQKVGAASVRRSADRRPR